MNDLSPQLMRMCRIGIKCPDRSELRFEDRDWLSFDKSGQSRSSCSLVMTQKTGTCAIKKQNKVRVCRAAQFKSRESKVGVVVMTTDFTNIARPTQVKQQSSVIISSIPAMETDQERSSSRLNLRYLSQAVRDVKVTCYKVHRGQYQY
ncbi:hypothetical protein FPSE_11579 [Fusarium pseudograminearum CS3096]|uniref:Uncharacterized protein n=1 Tax=Fusarium pseudograminearum (strain CS3096) TaxID=1028729 RepID=K3VX41_FUSPC|nr:hypothetical protein FPSE_11579 [Fusarium pseudograminearum CS3096]EKJ68240.1 hypothetical protein FPSE_11579 [Fusarium pseudograminearum CS3096]